MKTRTLVHDEFINPSLAAWKAFITDGTILTDQVRPVIARSWQRCRSAGLDPWINAAKQDFSLLKSKRSENRKLLSAAGPSLQLALGLLNTNISLSDSNGFVFELISPLKYYPRSLAALHAENLDGTSCITVSLAEHIPVRVDSYEHYAIGGHTYSGVTCPIRDESGLLLGYMHAVNPFAPLAPGALPLIIAAVGLTEYRLTHNDASFQDEKVRQAVHTMLGACSQGTALLDGDGTIMDCNTAFDNAIGLPEKGVTAGMHFGDLLVDPGKRSNLTSSVFVRTDDLAFKFRGRPENNGVEIEFRPIQKCQVDFCDTDNHLLLVFSQPASATQEKKQFRTADIEKKETAIFEACNCIGYSPAWEEVKKKVLKAAPFPTNILLQGESGTGKEVVAKLLHVLSNRRGNFVGINCGAIPKDFLYSELFGYEEGAFTGARKGGSVGKFEYAHGGTLFLDEIGEMSKEMQISLLRAIQERTITRFGSNETKAVDVRIIAATNRNLSELIQNGQFREDLYYRLSVIEITLPALRDRLDDIPLLVRYYMTELSRQYKMEPMTITEGALAALSRYKWPGNVRQLKNVIEKALILASEGIITERLLTSDLVLSDNEYHFPDSISAGDLNNNERRLIMEMLGRYNGNIARSAKTLKISRGTLYRKIKKYNIKLDTKAV